MILSRFRDEEILQNFDDFVNFKHTNYYKQQWCIGDLPTGPPFKVKVTTPLNFQSRAFLTCISTQNAQF